MKIAKVDEFESSYMNKFRALAGSNGVIVETQKDRAAFDLGLIPTQDISAKGSKLVSPFQVWFQLKGVQASTASAKEILASGAVKVIVRREHLHFWYYYPSPVYLVAYAEATDEFYVLDMKRWIAEHGGAQILSLSTATKTIAVPTRHVLSDAVFARIRRDAQVPTVAETISGKPREAQMIIRDDAIIWRLGTLKERKSEMRVRLIKYGSKTRSEVHFEEKSSSDSDWQPVRVHWQFMMGELYAVFPYIDFKPYFPEHVLTARRNEEGYVVSIDREDDFGFDEDEEFEDGELIDLPDGRLLQGQGQFEMFEFTFRPKLNKIGRQWADALKALVATGFLAIPEEPEWVSVAPWHAPL